MTDDDLLGGCIVFMLKYTSDSDLQWLILWGVDITNPDGVEKTTNIH